MIERLGKYRIHRALGKGAMGTVYLAFDPDIEREVAIKTIRKDTIDPDLAAQYLARFRNEAKAAGRLSHPHIVAVHEYGDDAMLTYIVMEYVNGSGLRDHVRMQGAFRFGQLVDLVTALLDALDYAHERGIVHRDIKPSNLLVTDAGFLKVADFGIARIDRTNLTSVGMVIGTPAYMSPEQCRGEETDGRSDLFSAGVVLYELMTGEKPFAGPAESLTHRICHDDPVPPSRRAALKLPPAVDELVGRALAKDPASRFPTAAAFRAALLEVAKLGVEVDEGQGTTVVNIGTVMLKRAAPQWDGATLDSVSQELARFLGPMARVLVQKAAAVASDRAELCAVLAEKIEDTDTRRRFVEAFQRVASGVHARVPGAGTAPGTAPSRPGSRAATSAVETSSAGVPLDDAFVDQVNQRLTVRIGPIARVITRKAAQQARTHGDFVRRVADALDPAQREAFLRDMGYVGS